MSAWYIFSSLGFYPVTPGTDLYAIGTPSLPKATIYFDPDNRDKKFEIIAENVSAKNIYVQSATLNGVPLDKPFIHHADIVKGGTLVFKMGSKPKKDW
jgi:putative alpha-1,2-mannosidase